MGFFQVEPHSELPVVFLMHRIHLLFGPLIAHALDSRRYLASRFRRGLGRFRKARLNAAVLRDTGRSAEFARRPEARALLTVGMGMAVLAIMLMPAPAHANEFNLADRLLKNLDTLNRMQSHGAAILIPAEFQKALDAHGEAMRHARAIVKLRAFQMEVQGRRTANGGGRNVRGATLDSLNRWVLLEVIEHDSVGIAVCETVDAVAHRFAVLRGARWLVRQFGYPAPELSGPGLPDAFRERVKVYSAALKRIEGALKLLKAARGDSVAETIHRHSAQSETEEAALWVHRADRPDLYSTTAWRR